MASVTRGEFTELKKTVDHLKETYSKKINKVKREPSKYNIFMSKKMTSIKKKNPDLSQPEVFKQAISDWNQSKTK